MIPPALECRAVAVSYGAVPVLRDVTLALAADEIVALLGPSGSGKSTLLAAVAGFVPPTAGTVLLAGDVVATPARSIPPEARSVGVVFQHYALWPHLSAVETVAYPLRRAGVGRAPAHRRAAELLERMGIAELADRKPAELSGGQQQRVGLARALARTPAVYLFDEPTAHLDSPLRAALQEELGEQRRTTGAAALYATHDAPEALAVADRVALLRDGAIAQVGGPARVYEQPVDLWAARLTGPASVLQAHVTDVREPCVQLQIAGESLWVEGGTVEGGAVVLVRPEWATLGGDLPGRVQQAWYRGAHTDYRLDTPAGVIDVRGPGRPSCVSGERVSWSLQHVWVSGG